MCCRRIVLAAALVHLYGQSAAAQTVLTLEEVIARARERAASVSVARARIAEAEAGLLDASVRFRDNPSIEGAAGPRVGRGERSTEIEVGASQTFETGGQRRARIAGATAVVAREQAAVVQTARDAIFDAAGAFLRGIAAGERLRTAEEADTIGREILAATERRYALGDIAAIDLNLARIDTARTTAELRAARADLTEAIGVLRAILRLPETDLIELRGTLSVMAPPPLPVLQQLVAKRPDFAVLDAEAREAEAQVRLGRSLRRADVGVLVGYAREESKSIALGGLTITLPAFQRGQGTTALGAARAARVQLQIDTTRELALAELAAAYNAYQQRSQLVRELELEASATISDNESLARRSYDAGELNLMEFLLIRRDALQMRVLIVERRLEAALSRLAVDYIAGVLQ